MVTHLRAMDTQSVSSPDLTRGLPLVIHVSTRVEGVKQCV